MDKPMQVATDALGGAKTKRPRKKIKMEIEKTENKGFHVRNTDDAGAPKSFVFPDLNGVHTHIDKHYGGKKATPQESKVAVKDE